MSLTVESPLPRPWICRFPYSRMPYFSTTRHVQFLALSQEACIGQNCHRHQIRHPTRVGLCQFCIRALSFLASPPQTRVRALAQAKQGLTADLQVGAEACPLAPWCSKSAKVQPKVTNAVKRKHRIPAKSAPLSPHPRTVRVLDPEKTALQQKEQSQPLAQRPASHFLGYS